MAYTFSIDQQNIIDSRNQNLLVSAAAGSGKTSRQPASWTSVLTIHVRLWRPGTTAESPTGVFASVP